MRAAVKDAESTFDVRSENRSFAMLLLSVNGEDLRDLTLWQDWVFSDAMVRSVSCSRPAFTSWRDSNSNCEVSRIWMVAT